MRKTGTVQQDPLDRLVVIDTETTGLDPEKDRVISLAAVPITNGTIDAAAAREVLIDPQMAVPPESTAIHGLRDADLVGARTRQAALAELGPLFTGRVIVGHNLGFDLAFLGLEPRTEATVDTLAVSRLLWPGPGVGHSLDAVAGRVGVSPKDRHSALGDAQATAEVMMACLPLLRARGLTSPELIAAAALRDRRRRDQLKRSIRRRSRTRPARPRRTAPRRRSGLPQR